MTDPIGVRNVIVQSSAVEKIQQVQQQQGDLHQRSMAHPNQDEQEKPTREVQTAKEGAEAKIKSEEENQEKGKKNQNKHLRKTLEQDITGDDGATSDTENVGFLVDVKV